LTFDFRDSKSRILKIAILENVENFRKKFLKYLVNHKYFPRIAVLKIRDFEWRKSRIKCAVWKED